MAKQKGDVITGTVVEALPNTMFRVRVVFDNLPEKYRDDITKKLAEEKLKEDRKISLENAKTASEEGESQKDDPEETKIEPKKEHTQIIAYLAGKMKYHRIKVIVGDTVEVLLDPYGGKGRVVRRR